MALKSMKRDGDDDMCCMGWSPDNYPCGLQLYLDEDQCEALGLGKALKPGTEVTISAKAIVISSTDALSRDADKNGNDVSMTVQITDMDVRPGGAVRDAAAVLYGKSDD